MAKPQSTFAHSSRDLNLIHKIEDAVARVYPKTRVLIWRSFLQGLFVALGATVGLSIVIALLSFLLGNLSFIPGLGTFQQNILPLHMPTPTP